MSYKVIDPRIRYPDLSMSDEEAKNIMEAERQIGGMLRSRFAVEVALMLERADDDEFDAICSILEESTHEN